MKTRIVHNTGKDIPIATYESEDLDSATPQHVVIANGFVGGKLAGLFAKRLAHVATNEFEVSAYEEPHVGSGIYAESYRAEIFDKAVRSLGERVTILAHSRGTIAWAEAGSRLIDDELVQGFAGLTPLGVNQLSNVSRFERYLRLGQEIVRPSIETRESTVMSARVAGHILQRFKYPLAALGEVDRTLQIDTTESIISTSQTIPTVMIAGTRDSLVPPGEVRSHLDTDSGYQGAHVEIPATHLDAFANSRHSLTIYEALRDIGAQE